MQKNLTQRTIAIVTAVSSNSNGLGLSDVSRATGIPKATCYRVLGDLVAANWVSLDAKNRTYRISVGLLGIVEGWIGHNSALEAVNERLLALSQKVQETCGLDVLVPPYVMVIAQRSGPRLISQVSPQVPRRQPIDRTATGWVFLAECLKLNNDPLAILKGEVGPNRVRDLLPRLQEVCRRGYAHTVDELEEGAAAFAVPVESSSGSSYATWVGGPSSRLAGNGEAVVEQLQLAAREISAILVSDLI